MDDKGTQVDVVSGVGCRNLCALAAAHDKCGAGAESVDEPAPFKKHSLDKAYSEGVVMQAEAALGRCAKLQDPDCMP